MPKQWVRLAVVIALGSLLLSTAGAGAQSKKAEGITVTPVTDEFTVKPGETVTRTVRVINPTVEVANLYPRVLDFHTNNDKGQPVFYTVKDRSSRYALSEWVTFSKPLIRVAPNEEEKFEVIITAPSDAEPGGHYGAVLFSTEEPKLSSDTTQVGVVGLVGTLLLAQVPGNVTQKMVITDFDAPTVLIQPPAQFSLLFQNMGTVHLKPVGEIKIRNWSGATRTTLRVNEGGGNVLPESQRRFENVWPFDWKAFGKYTASVAVTYGFPEQQAMATRSFFVIPLWLIVLILALLLLIVWLFIRRRRRGRQVYVNNVPPAPKRSTYVMR